MHPRAHPYLRGPVQELREAAAEAPPGLVRGGARHEAVQRRPDDEQRPALSLGVLSAGVRRPRRTRNAPLQPFNQPASDRWIDIVSE